MNTKFFITFTFYILLIKANATTFYIDPIKGSMQNDGSLQAPWSTLEDVVNLNLINSFKYSTPYTTLSSLVAFNQNGPIHGGDTLILMNGLHGTLKLVNYHNLEDIVILAADGQKPYIKYVELTSCSKWKLEGLNLSSEPFGQYLMNDIVYLQTHSFQGPTFDITIKDCDIYSTLDSKDWTLEDWNTISRSGIRAQGNNILIEGNRLLNVDFGISLIGDGITVKNNMVKNFSGDGMRALGPNLLIEGNTIKNCYDVNENHDDGIQSFNLGTYDTRNITIRGNTIINYEDINQPFRGPLQGIGCFDGPFTNWTIENNVISVDHWHGISLYGAFDCKIINNTVIDPSPDTTPGPSWIRINPNKDGTASENNIVANNISNDVIVTGTQTYSNQLIKNVVNYNEHFRDFANYDFTLKSGSSAIDAANETFAPPFDRIGIARPQGLGSDVGAYEFVFTTGENILVAISDVVYPNPTFGILNFYSPFEKIDIYDSCGRLVISKRGLNYSVDLSELNDGVYYVVGDWYQACKIMVIH